jgi:hypothetical protein
MLQQDYTEDVVRQDSAVAVLQENCTVAVVRLGSTADMVLYCSCGVSLGFTAAMVHQDSTVL